MEVASLSIVFVILFGIGFIYLLDLIKREALQNKKKIEWETEQFKIGCFKYIDYEISKISRRIESLKNSLLDHIRDSGLDTTFKENVKKSMENWTKNFEVAMAEIREAKNRIDDLEKKVEVPDNSDEIKTLKKLAETHRENAERYRGLYLGKKPSPSVSDKDQQSFEILNKHFEELEDLINEIKKCMDKK